MIETPNLQTVLTLTGGVSPLPQSVFVWGTASRAFSVGTHADWVINAPGVAPVHFFLRFDGKMLHIAGGPSGAPLSVSGVVVDQTWRPLPVFSLVAFGGAQLRVTCEPAAPRPQSAPPVGVTAPVAPAPQQVLKPVDHLQSTVPLNDVRVNEVRRVRTEPVVLADAGQRVWPRSDPPAAGASPSYPPVAGPHPGATLVSPGAPQANMSEVPSVRRELPQTPAEMESTLSDSGALKEHAKRVASEPKLARASADAYLEAVRQQAGIQGSTPPPRTLEAARAEAQPLVPAAGSLPWTPSAAPSAAPPPHVPQEPEDASKAKGAKQKSSWVMRVTLILLPFAGYFAIFWEPPAEAPPPPEVSVSTPAGSAPAVSGTASVPAHPRLPLLPPPCQRPRRPFRPEQRQWEAFHRRPAALRRREALLRASLRHPWHREKARRRSRSGMPRCPSTSTGRVTRSTQRWRVGSTKRSRITTRSLRVPTQRSIQRLRGSFASVLSGSLNLE
jgi:hypothetical protein